MPRRFLALAAVGAVALAIAVWRADFFRAAPALTEAPHAAEASPPTTIGPPLYPPVIAPPPTVMPVRAAPLVLHDCRLAVMDQQEVPSQREGVLLFVGSEIEPGEQLPPERVVTVRLGDRDQQFRRLKEGDSVRAGQLLAYLDDRLSRDELAIKQARLTSARADLEAFTKSSEEARARYYTQVTLWRDAKGATSEEEMRTAKLTWERSVCEVATHREAVALAERELSQADTVQRMHQVRAPSAGVIKAIHKKAGEAVKLYESVVLVQQPARLRVEAAVDACHLASLHVGMKARVEPARPEGPRQIMTGHLYDVTAVSVARDAGKEVVLSADAGGTVYLWDRAAGRQTRALVHPAAVGAVTGSPPGSSPDLCLTGAADGVARLWRLDGTSTQPLRELIGHSGPVTCVGFSPDGKLCATGGEDRTIRLWDTATGALRYQFPAGHRAAVMSLQFTPRCQLVSAGRDNTVRVWALGREAARLETTFDQRTGEITHLGVRPDGGCVLHEQGSTLRLLSVPDGRTDGVVENQPRATHFDRFALFSPDSRLILAAGADGRLRLWQSPVGVSHAAMVRELVAAETAPACAAFAPDGSYVAVAGKDRRIRIWAVPAIEAETAPTAELTLIDRAVETSTREVRIWAELPNADGRCLPGTTATLVIDE